MAYAFRQKAQKSESSSGVLKISFSSAPLDGSALIMAVATTSGAAATQIDQDGAEWQLLQEAASEEFADENNDLKVRVQLWGAFNVQRAATLMEITFSGGTTDRGAIAAEYTGDTFLFPNPADRVVGDVGSSSSSTGPADTGTGGTTREAEELWVAAAANDSATLTWTSADSPFVLNDTVAIGSTGQLGFADALQSSTGALSAQINHSLGGGNWAITSAAVRGDLQEPAGETEEPVSEDPVTENNDHAGDAIDNLLEQFKSHDKR
jgi:hypothetical protein